MSGKQMYHMKDDKGYAGQHNITEDEAAKLRTKGWTVVLVETTDRAPEGHLHVISKDGHYLGARFLTQISAADLIRLGMHLVHVGDASKDMDEVREIQKLHGKVKEA